MNLAKTISFVFLGAVLTVAGCAKKSTDQASLTGTGFDMIATNEELAQLPQASTQSQQSAIEVLPIEPSPVTQAASSFSTVSTAAENTLSTTMAPGAREIQTALKNAGLYTGNIDGKIGPGTQGAIKAFQESNGLKVDGKVGPKTWAALAQYLTNPQITSTATATE